MEQLFAVRVLVHYHDKPKVDHDAVRRLLFAAGVESLPLLCADGTTLKLAEYINTSSNSRKTVVEVLGTSGTSLVQVASVFMLAEARAASDSLCTSPGELEVTCSALERLLGFLPKALPIVSTMDSRPSGRVKSATNGSRRTLHRLSRSTISESSQVSILRAVNAVLRLSDVATHCLAVVSRQALASKIICETAVNLSTRLLALASALCSFQQIDSKPSLSFFSSNSLRTTLVAGAMHLGAINMEHVTIDAMAWVQTANRVLLNNGRTAFTSVSILSALFGGMMSSAKRYEQAERETHTAEGAVCLLSTLHLILSLDVTRRPLEQSSAENPTTSILKSIAKPSKSENMEANNNHGTLSQAARSFLGERVVAAEEDGDEGRIATDTVYHACEEYAKRAGEAEGIIGLLVRLFEAAGRRFSQESADESVVSISEGTLPCPPDESDDCSDGPPLRQDSSLLSAEHVESKSRDFFGTGVLVGLNSDGYVEQNERIELHKEVAALALDTLGKWLEKANSLRQYKDLDIIRIASRICSSASFFLFNSSSASYDLRAAMIDFGSFIGPELRSHVEQKPVEARQRLIEHLIKTLTETCQRTNPVLSGIVGSFQNEAVVNLWTLCESRGMQSESKFERHEEIQGLTTDNILYLLLAVTTEANSLALMGCILDYLRGILSADQVSDLPVSHVTAALLLLSYGASVSLGMLENLEGHRIAFAALYHRDPELALEPSYPEILPESAGAGVLTLRKMDLDDHKARQVWEVIKHVPKIMEQICAKCCSQLDRDLQVFSSSSQSTGTDYIQEASALNSVKHFYHLYWSYVMVTRLVHSFKPDDEVGESSDVHGLDDKIGFEMLSPFMVERASKDPEMYEILKNIVGTKSSAIPILYSLECVMLYKCSSPTVRVIRDVEWLLTTVLRTCLECIANTVYNEPAENYSQLLDAFRRSPKEAIRKANNASTDRRTIFKNNANDIPVCSSLQQVMFYLRSVGSGKTPFVLASVFLSSAKLLNHITPTALESMRNLIIQVASHIIFVPQFSTELAASMWVFIDAFLCRTFDIAPEEHGTSETIITFIARVCGFAKLAERDTSSPRVIRALCMFARDTASIGNLDEVLRIVAFQSKMPEDITNSDLRKWLNTAIPRLSLSNLLSCLLVPADESAVAVSHYGESFSFLTEACHKSKTWRVALVSGLEQLHETDSLVWKRMVLRSIVESATLNDGVLLLIEKVIGMDDSVLAAQLLNDMFRATCTVFAEVLEVSLEGKCRILNFAVRLTLCYGLVSARCSKSTSPACLEPAMFGFLLQTLQTTSNRLLFSPGDHDSKHLVLFLCDLLGCIVKGLSSPRNEQMTFTGLGAIESEKKDSEENHLFESTNSMLSLLRKSASCSQASKDIESHPLCTYTSTGSQFVEQHWYFCYSCELSGSEGVCSTCARVCHRDCELAYSKFSRFFCDCGAGCDPRQESTSHGIPSSDDVDGSNANSQEPVSQRQQLPTSRPRKRKACLCLKKNDDSEAKPENLNHVSKDDRNVPEVRANMIESELEEALVRELRELSTDEKSLRSKHGKELRLAFRTALNESVNTLTGTALFLTREIEGTHIVRESDGIWTPLLGASGEVSRLSQANDFVGITVHDQSAVSTKVLRPGSLDIQLAKDSSNSLSANLTPRRSLIAYSSFDRIVAVAEKSNIIEFLDASEELFSDDGMAEKLISRVFRRVSVPFDVKHILFHPSNSNILLVVGKEKVCVFVRAGSSLSTTWTRMDVEVGLSEFIGSDGQNALIDASWIDEDATLLLVITTDFVKIFDIAVDTFCPCFFARTPATNAVSQNIAEGNDVDIGKRSSEKKKIVAAAFARDYMESWKDQFLVFILRSDRKMFVTKSKRNQAVSPVFEFCFEAKDSVNENSSIVSNMIYYADESMFIISFASGNILCLPFSVRSNQDQLQVVIQEPHVFNSVFESNSVFEVDQVKGLERTFAFCEKQSTMSYSGILNFEDEKLVVKLYSSPTASSVLGFCSYSSSAFTGEPSLPGGLFLLDDGSVHRIDITSTRRRRQIPQQTVVSASTGRQRKLLGSTSSEQMGARYGGTSIPPAVGFFEKCRLVSDSIRIERLDVDPKLSADHDRISVILAGSGSDCIVSPVENQPFRFAAIIESPALVLVGARMRFGGTDRSRQRVPAEVKVFNRTIRWSPRNGVKRWLDIPLTVPESVKSPHKITFELSPRRMNREGRYKADGLCAIDALELYAVSNIEFTERKLMHEKAKSENQHSRKEKEEDVYEDLRNIAANMKEYEPITSSLNLEHMSAENNALLTILNCIEKKPFLSSSKAGLLLSEMNNMWSKTFLGLKISDQTFLDYMVKPCLRLCLPEISKTSSTEESCPDVLKVFPAGVCSIILKEVVKCYDNGITPHFTCIEKGLYMAATLARSLFAVSVALPAPTAENWASSYDCIMPNEEHLLLLLRAHVAMGRSGRLLYRSIESATINAVDVFMVLSIRRGISAQNKEAQKATNFLVEMLCSYDQRLRIRTAQRLTELFNSLNCAWESTTPFESVLTFALIRLLRPSKNNERISDSRSGQDEGSMGSDDPPRWAYRCDSCGEVCNQEWWHCADCEDFDLCTKCLRSSTPCVSENHKETHILLKGTIEEDVDGQPMSGIDHGHGTSIGERAQGILSTIITKILEQVMAEENNSSHWRYLDAAEAISQLLGSGCPPAVKLCRMEALFSSSFPSLLRRLAESIGDEYHNAKVAGDGVLTVTPRCADVFILMLNILLCASGSNMASFVHKHDVPNILSELLKKMHPKLQELAFFVSSSDLGAVKRHPNVDIMSRSVWNGPLSEISSLPISSRKSNREEIVSEMLGSGEHFGTSNYTFINVMTEVLHVLDFSFKTAANSSITKQMKRFPRKLLCDIINFSDSCQSKHDPTLLKTLAGSSEKLLGVLSLDNTDELNDILDRYLYHDQGKRLSEVIHAKRLNGLSLPYESALEVALVLGNILKAARRHPETWRNYTVTDETIHNILFDVARVTKGELQSAALQLLAASVTPSTDYASRVMKSKSILCFEPVTRSQMDQDLRANSFKLNPEDEDGPQQVERVLEDLFRKSAGPGQVSAAVITKEGSALVHFLLFEVMLRSHNKSCRLAAADVLTFIIIRAASNVSSFGALIEELKTGLQKALRLMPYAGTMSDGIMTCLRLFVKCCQNGKFGASSEAYLNDLIADISALLTLNCNQLNSHPNSRLYGKLSSILDIGGYYLEADPCLTCAATTWESSEVLESRLETIKAETKYTDSAIMHRLVAPYEIFNVRLKVIDPRRTRRAKKIEVFYSSRTVSDAAELKAPSHPWKKLDSFDLSPRATESVLSFSVPIQAANVKLEFAEFYEAVELQQASVTSDSDQNDVVPASTLSETHRNSRGAAESLQCPRCSRAVTDRHGICRNCHENAYQCRQCRNINYENLDGFLCNECGYCKHGRFEFSVLGKPAYIIEPVLNDEDRRRSSEIIERETANVHRCMEQLARIRSTIIRSLATGSPADQIREKGKILANSRIILGDIVPPRTELAMFEALLEGQVSHEVEEAANSTQGGVSITEDVLGDGNGSVEVHEREQSHQTGSNSGSPLNRSRRVEPHQSLAAVESSTVSKTTSVLSTTYSKECRAIYTAMSRGVRVLAITRAELVRYANSIDRNRLKHANDLSMAFEKAPQEVLGTNSNIRNSVQPCCYTCTQAFVANCVKLLGAIMNEKVHRILLDFSSQLVTTVLRVYSQCEKFEVRVDIRNLITSLVRDNESSTKLVCQELARKISFCIESWETVDPHTVAQFDIGILESISQIDDDCWEERLRLVMTILFKASRHALTCSSVAESIILPSLQAALRILREDVGLSIQTDDSSDALALDSAFPSNGQSYGFGVNDTNQEPQNRSQYPEAGMSSEEGGQLEEQGSNQNSDEVRTSEEDSSHYNPETDSNRAGAGSDNDSQSCHNQERNSSLRGLSPAQRIGMSTGEHQFGSRESGTETPEMTMSVQEVKNVLGDLHDKGLVSADISDWLKGRSSQTTWFQSLLQEKRSVQSKNGTELPQAEIEQGLLSSCFQLWRSKAKSVDAGLQTSMNALSFEQSNWIVRLMLFTPCTAVRKECCALLNLLCNDEETLRLQLLDVLTGESLYLATTVEDMSQQFFDLLENVLEPHSYRLYLISTGFLTRLTSLIRSMAEKLVISEVESDSSIRLMSFMEGYSLKRLVAVLSLFIEVVPSQQTDLRKRLFGGDGNPIVSSLQRAYLCLRKLISMRTTLTEECATRLCEILLSNRFLFLGPSIMSVVSACVRELKAAKDRNDAQAIAILLEELCIMLCPERKEPTCMLSLNKAPTQEEFIRGNMARNPYTSSSFDGPLMRDVKNKICRDLDLPGLLEDDFAMELLVAGNLIKLDLPIMGVYEHIWRGSAAAAMASSVQPTQHPRVMGLRRVGHTGNQRNNGGLSRIVWNRGGILGSRRPTQDRNGDLTSGQEDRPEPPMVIIYRLSGLDGEATEPIVESLPSDTVRDNEEEEQFRDTIILGQVGGLDVLFELLSVVESWGDDAETAVRAPALRLLLASCQVAENRATLAKSSNAVSTLLDCAASAFEHAQGSPAAVKSAESLLIAAEQILAQQRRDLECCSGNSEESMNLALSSPDEVISRVRVFLGRLSLATSPTAENSILHLLPFLVQGNPSAVDLVLQHMWLNWDLIDASDEEQKKARQLGTVLLATPRDIRGNEFIAHAVRSGIAENAVLQIVKRFPVPRQERRMEWQQSLEGHGPPLILRLLTGMSFFLGSGEDKLRINVDLRNCFSKQEEIIPVLCQVEMAVSDNSVGSSAEELLEALSRDPIIYEKIKKEREAIKSARREAARLSRMSILRETGLGSVSDQTKKEADTNTVDAKDTDGKSEPSFLKLLEELPDEKGPSCVVCGDGFQCRPEEALGLYVHCRKVSLDYSSGLAANSRAESRDERSVENVLAEPQLNWDVWANGSARTSSGSSSKTSGSSCFTTVTHMNAIHLTCHKEAARMDRSSRRDEWDGASLRNSQTLCNNMFPVRPPASMKTEGDGEHTGTIKTAKMSYSAAVEGYFRRLSSLGRVSVPQSKAILYDLGRSFLRFADGRSAVFSEYSQGGGAHSNACFIPHLVQMAIHMIELTSPLRTTDLFTGNPSLQMMEIALSKYLKEDEQGDLTYYVASSLILHDIDQWNRAGEEFLKRCLRESPLPKPILLRFIAFADLVNRVMKKNILVVENQHWLESLRMHIGLDETFAQSCGDVINERWESYIRGISNGAQFLDGVRQNIEYSQEDRDSHKCFFNGISEFISGMDP